MSQMTSNQPFPVVVDSITKLQIVSMCVFIGVLLQSSPGNAGAAFWISMTGVLFTSIWFVAHRKTWLALVSSIVFLVGILAFSKSLF